MTSSVDRGYGTTGVSTIGVEADNWVFEIVLDTADSPFRID